MPAFMALSPVSVSALPSNGRMTMTSTPLLMSVSTWLICWLTSLVPSTASRVTSEYSPAVLLALVVMAPIQPWSASGAEKPMVIASPGVSLPLPVPVSVEPDVVAAALVAAASSLSLLVQPARATPAPIAPAPEQEPPPSDVAHVRHLFPPCFGMWQCES